MKNNQKKILITSIWLSLSLILIFVLFYITRQPKTPQIAHANPETAAFESPFGIDLGTLGPFWNENEPVDFPILAQLLSQAGVRWVRVDLVWKFAEPTNDNWNEDHLAKVVTLLTTLKNAGLLISLDLRNVPDWASDVPGGDFRYPPANLIDWDDFVSEMVMRLGNYVDVWEIENEVSHKIGYVENKEKYVEMVSRAVNIIKAAYPNSLIALSSFWLPPPQTWIDPEAAVAAIKYWLVQTDNLVDIFNLHIYATDDLQVAEQTQTFRNYIAEAGTAEKPIWLTETNICPTRQEACLDPADGGIKLKSRYQTAINAGIDKVFWHPVKQGGPWGPGLLEPPVASMSAGYQPHEPIFSAFRDMTTNFQVDANSDWVVDILDFQIWVSNYVKHTSVGVTEGDFDNSDKTNSLDFAMWREIFGPH